MEGYRNLREVYRAWEREYGKGGMIVVDYEISADNETLTWCGIISDIDEDHPDTIVVVSRGVTRIISDKDVALNRVKVFYKGATIPCDEYMDIIFDIVNTNARFVVIPKAYRKPPESTY